MGQRRYLPRSNGLRYQNRIHDGSRLLFRGLGQQQQLYARPPRDALLHVNGRMVRQSSLVLPAYGTRGAHRQKHQAFDE